MKVIGIEEVSDLKSNEVNGAFKWALNFPELWQVLEKRNHVRRAEVFRE